MSSNLLITTLDNFSFNILHSPCVLIIKKSLRAFVDSVDMENQGLIVD